MELLLFEPHLEHAAGHYNRYIRVLAGEAARQGFRLTVATSSIIQPGLKAMLEARDVEILPVFDPTPFRLHADAARRAGISRQLCGVALDCLARRPLARTAWLSGTGALLDAACLFATTTRQPFVFQMLDFANDWPSGELTAPEPLREAVARATACGMRIRVQSNSIAQQLQREIGTPIGVFPAILDLHPLKQRPRRPRPVIGMTNMFRNAKDGSGALPALMAHGDRIALVLHTGQDTTVEAVNTLKARVDALARHHRLKHEQVQIVAGVLPPEQYLAMWQGLDATLMPYDPTRYVRQGSGVLFESLADAIIPIVPLGTSMAASLTELDLGLTYDPAAHGSLQGAIGRLLSDFERLAARQRAFAPLYREANAPAKVVAALMMDDAR
ncbi:MAG: hypothetical protein U1E16_01290 [Hyphomicrobiales bacterium]